MKNLKTLLIATLLIAAGTAQAQEQPKYKIQGTEIVSTQKAKHTAEPVKTNLTYRAGEQVYPVFQSAKGAYFIIRTSKKSGKEYKQYLKTE